MALVQEPERRMTLVQPDLRSSPGLRDRWNTPFARDVIAGLSGTPKTLQAKYFYDARGSELFEDICGLAEYYPTRTEAKLLSDISGEIASLIPDNAALVEFGSGASAKTRTLLDAAPQLSAYVPIDISEEALAIAAASISRDYPSLNVRPLVADFTSVMALPLVARGRPKVGFFPGSTIGNFTHTDAVRFLKRASALLGPESRFILGADLVKDLNVLVRAYDDGKGVTAAFNLNLLTRINRELDGDIDPSRFQHRALWNDEHSRIEMHLVSRTAQRVEVAGRSFAFAHGETIHTENSHKFTRGSLETIAAKAGWTTERYWQSQAPEFAVMVMKAV